MTGEASEDALRVELYSKQIDWTARYPGADGEFGQANYNLITPMNALGIVTEDGIAAALTEIEEKIAKVEEEINYEKGHLLAEWSAIESELRDDHGHDGHGHDGHSHDGHGHDAHADSHGDGKQALEARMAEIEHMLESDKVNILTEAAFEAKEDKLYRLLRHRQRIQEIRNFDFDGELTAWETGMDDQIVKGEFHLPVGREVEFVFRSRDVIHSAYMPQFRAQMNTVPGVPTRFKMTPTITTDSMRTVLENPEFDYVLLCNKVCGAAHFNMQMKIVIESQEAYDAWMSEQGEFLVKEGSEEPEMEQASAQKESQTITASL
jgi:heme/copper-type cytochrome/quinol oxidase subunit 2